MSGKWTPERRARQSAIIKECWASGKWTVTARRKMASGLRSPESQARAKATRATPEYKARLGIILRQRPARLHTPETKEKISRAQRTPQAKEGVRKMRAALLALPSHQCGPAHFAAGRFSVRSPEGVVYRFRNAADFVRTHLDLFAPSDALLRTRWVCRASVGIRSLRPSNKRTVPGTWKGWTWYSQEEQLENSGGDLLGR